MPISRKEPATLQYVIDTTKMLRRPLKATPSLPLVQPENRKAFKKSEQSSNFTVRSYLEVRVLERNLRVVKNNY